MNKLKEKPEVQEEPETEEVEQQPKKKKKNWLLNSLDVTNWVNYEMVSNNLPYILFMAFLGIVYIANAHYAEKSVRETNDIEKKMKELQWEYTTTKSELEYNSKQSEVAKMVEQDGLKELTVPPQKITITHGH
jgi:hypothetical protein